MNLNKLGVLAALLSLSLLTPRAQAVPTVTIDDLTENVTVSGTGFNTIPIVGTQLFTSGTLLGLTEGRYFAGLGGNVGNTPAFNFGGWTEPDGTRSDLFYVQTIPLPVVGGLTVGVFFSDPSLPPASITIPPIPLILPNGLTIDLSGAPNLRPEPNGLVDISPVTGVIVNASSDVEPVPDAGTTLALLGIGILAVTGAGRLNGRLEKVA